ncbi:hypothetical protein CDAR_448911 [Caerostris darwini]|uniref:Uncharacterized protein n=1 Tax=Caerostris darwini TaxID=1538125 RepID=A0AAV4WAG8_9ARAC|nr:hypothetical protein CDAR_448911 [Caerostris darwini]
MWQESTGHREVPYRERGDGCFPLLLTPNPLSLLENMNRTRSQFFFFFSGSSIFIPEVLIRLLFPRLFVRPFRLRGDLAGASTPLNRTSFQVFLSAPA